MRQVIINIHGIGSPERPLETGEDRYWISEDLFKSCIALSQRLKHLVKVSFTFDDGNKSDIEIGAPALEEQGLTAQFFVLSTRTGRPGSLSESDLIYLQKMGHSIGVHGADHVDWTTLDSKGQIREFDYARDYLQQVVQKPIRSAAIPFGRYNRNVLFQLKKRGFQRVFSSDGGSWTQKHSPIPRNSLTFDMAPENIEDILLGRETVSTKLRRSLAMRIKKRT